MMAHTHRVFSMHTLFLLLSFMLLELILIATLGERYSFCLLFIDEGIEAQRG